METHSEDGVFKNGLLEVGNGADEWDVVFSVFPTGGQPELEICFHNFPLDGLDASVPDGEGGFQAFEVFEFVDESKAISAESCLSEELHA